MLTTSYPTLPYLTVDVTQMTLTTSYPTLHHHRCNPGEVNHILPCPTLTYRGPREVEPRGDGLSQGLSVLGVRETGTEAVESLLEDEIGSRRRIRLKAPRDPPAPLHQVPAPHNITAFFFAVNPTTKQQKHNFKMRFHEKAHLKRRALKTNIYSEHWQQYKLAARQRCLTMTQVRRYNV